MKKKIQECFEKIEIASDGNCLFRAILYCLFRDDSLYSNLREDVCKYMLGNRKTFESYLRNTETLDRDFDTYIKKMTVNKVWGGLAEVHAAALLLHFNYAIYLPDKNVPFVKQTPFPNEITIYLQFKNGNHFNSLMLPDKKIKIQLKKTRR